MGCGASSPPSDEYAATPSRLHHDAAPLAAAVDNVGLTRTMTSTSTLHKRKNEKKQRPMKKASSGMEFVSVLTDQEREQAAQLRCRRTSVSSLSRGASHFGDNYQNPLKGCCQIRRIGGGFLSIDAGAPRSPSNSRRRSISGVGGHACCDGSSVRSDHNPSLASTLLSDTANTPRSLCYVPFGQDSVQEITPSAPQHHQRQKSLPSIFGTCISSSCEEEENLLDSPAAATTTATGHQGSSSSHPLPTVLALPNLPSMSFDESRSPRTSNLTKAASCDFETLNDTISAMMATKESNSNATSAVFGSPTIESLISLYNSSESPQPPRNPLQFQKQLMAARKFSLATASSSTANNYARSASYDDSGADGGETDKLQDTTGTYTHSTSSSYGRNCLTHTATPNMLRALDDKEEDVQVQQQQVQ